MTLYVPKLSEQSLCRPRRIAWAANRPMTKTLDAVIEYIARHIDQQAVCTACRDNSRCGIMRPCGTEKDSREGRQSL